MFRCFVVRHDPKHAENFIPLFTLPSELNLQETWKRNGIKEVHFITQQIAGVAFSAAELLEYKKHPGFGCHDSNILTFQVKKRVEA